MMLFLACLFLFSLNTVITTPLKLDLRGDTSLSADWFSCTSIHSYSSVDFRSTNLHCSDLEALFTCRGNQNRVRIYCDVGSTTKRRSLSTSTPQTSSSSDLKLTSIPSTTVSTTTATTEEIGNFSHDPFPFPPFIPFLPDQGLDDDYNSSKTENATATTLSDYDLNLLAEESKEAGLEMVLLIGGLSGLGIFGLCTGLVFWGYFCWWRCRRAKKNKKRRYRGLRASSSLSVGDQTQTQTKTNAAIVINTAGTSGTLGNINPSTDMKLFTISEVKGGDSSSSADSLFDDSPNSSLKKAIMKKEE